MNRSVWRFAGLIFALAFPSMHVVQKYLGNAGVATYVGFVLATVWIGDRFLLRRLLSWVSERWATRLSVATFVGIFALFAVLYPLANSGRFGPGSDSDDALEIATTELLHARYPYHRTTYLGNPISPMPGSLVLAVPFVLLGVGAAQNPTLLLALFLAIRHRLRDPRAPLFLIWTLLALSPTVLHHIIVGLDYSANTIYVLLFIWLLISAAERPRWRDWHTLIAGVPLGIALSSRANFSLLLPLVYSALIREVGWKRASLFILVPCVTAALLTIPFYLHDPVGFSPLHTSRKLAQYDSILPHAGLLIPLSVGVLAIALCTPHLNKDLAALFRNCALIQAAPILCAVLLASAQRGELDLQTASFGDFFLYFGVTAYWLRAFSRDLPGLSRTS